MSTAISKAPGAPGVSAHWISSAKSGVGTSLSFVSRVWFTLSHGILNEIYYPRIDQACIRELGLIITDGHNFFSEEKCQTNSNISYVSEGIPAYRMVNNCIEGRYRIEKDILVDPHRDVVLQRVRFIALKGLPGDYHLYVYLAPHLGNRGGGNTAWVDDYKGSPMLFAQRENITLALACSLPWLGRSCGFVGASGPRLDLKQHKLITAAFAKAENGNVALAGEVDLTACAGEFVLALGFGQNCSEAANHALASLLGGFKKAQADYISGWKMWQQGLRQMKIKDSAAGADLYRVSTAVLRAHEAKTFPGGIVASLSIPWGFAKGDDDLGGYHLVWPRDLVEAAEGLLAAGAYEDVLRVINYLQVTQEADGHWPQNMWLDGKPYWLGIQMDETAFPILLVGLTYQEKILDNVQINRLWPMMRRAAGFLVCNGPVTPQDRWEEDAGYSPFTLAAEIASLLVAADMADLEKESAVAIYLRQTADAWCSNIEHWTYVTGTELARKVGVEGYYVRIAPPEVSDAKSPVYGFVPIKNRPVGQNIAPASYIVSTDALALVRFGLRRPSDRRIINTVKVIDALLKVDTPFGPAWHRYNDDGYGEHKDGSPFDSTGIGRAWPLFCGERAHYELAAGRRGKAEQLLQTMAAFANEGGMIPEQVWDAPDIPEKELFLGRPSGSAMPLVWAHAEYIKLLRSIQQGRVFDMPQQSARRYLKSENISSLAIWRFNHKCRRISAGKTLRIEVREEAAIRWSSDSWQTVQNIDTQDTGMGIHKADLSSADLPAGTIVSFTFDWRRRTSWEGTNFEVKIG